MINWNDVIRFATKGGPPPQRRVEKTEQEWRNVLTAQQFHITRMRGTERPFTGALCHSYAPGAYACVCCGELLFDAQEKFESHSGWPSFTQPAHPSAIAYVKDTSHGMVRVEVLCAVCDAHLGHVFPDGPPPSGLRYCINSESLVLEDRRV
jgi:methionine-R-sulfoxide reductase